MYVYCMFCETQRCKVIAKLMEIRGAMRSFSPQIVRRQRKKGQNLEKQFDLLPGYVFVFSEERMVDYTQFFGMDLGYFLGPALGGFIVDGSGYSAMYLCTGVIPQVICLILFIVGLFTKK